MLQGFFEFLKFLKYNTHPSRMELKSRNINMFGAKKSFEMFKDPKFRELVRFSDIDQVEQDRIFNELVVTNLIMAILLLEQSVREANDSDKKEYFRALKDSLPKYFIEYLTRLGIAGEFTEIWNKLIELRHDEYIQEVNEFRKEFLNSGDEEISGLALEKNVLIFQALAFGLYRHVVRGKVIKDDPLYKYIQPYLVGVHKGILKRI